MEFRVLGPMEVYEGRRAVTIVGPKQRALLAFLLLHANESVSSERLIDALWPEERPKSAAKTLQVHVSQLRKALEPKRTPGTPSSLLRSGPGGYSIKLDPNELDLHRFERLGADAKTALAAGDPAAAASLLREALALWRGPALAEFAAEPFTALESGRLEELRLGALEERIEADLALGRHADLVAELDSLVRRQPLRERLRAQLMLALYRSGRQAEALRIYQETRRELVDELGIEPSRELQRLEQAILRQDPALDLPERRPAERSDEPRPRAPEETAVPTPAPPREPSDERKLATALFADLVGSTELGALDPERARVLLDRFYDAMAEEIEAASGTVEKFVGDAVMAVFGAPVAQEDHAERALHAALSMQRRLQELFDGRLELRIGVNTGEVVVGRAREGSSFVTGDAVNVAKRLEEAAAPGEILVGERTVAAVRGAFEFGEPAAVEAKGKSTGVVARRLVAATALTRPRGVGGLRYAFVGREAELELLQATYHRAVHESEPHLVSIVGDAGVGKTRLVREFSAWLAAESPQPLRRTGRCLPYGQGITYWPLGEVLKEELGIESDDSPDTVRRRLGERGILGLTLGIEAAADLHPLVARERLHEAWVEFLEQLVADRPAVLLIEDLHLAKSALLELLDRLQRDVRGPLLLIGTARPELADRAPTWGARGRNRALVWLEPLPPADTGHLLDALLGSEFPEPLRDRVLTSAEGNPFFVEELIATLIDQGVLEHREGGWAARELPSGFAIPDSVKAVLAARIDLLEPREKAALQAAAVIGRAFSTNAVRELLGGAEADFRVLEERDFLRRQRETAAADRELTFKHALTREVAYASLPTARRARLHAAFAEWLERTGGGRDEHAHLLGHHYGEAVRPEDLDLAWPDEHEEARRLRERALVWLRRAVELAFQRYAVDEELALLQRAVELETSEAARTDLWRAIAHANAVKYDKTVYRAAMTSAIDLCGEPEELAVLCSELAFQLAFRWGHTDDREEIERWLERALELAGAETPARAWALLARSYCDPLAAEAAAREATAIAERLPDVELRSYAFHACADCALAEGRYEEARRWAERRLELIDRIRDPDHHADVYWSAMPSYLAEGRFDEARRLARLHDDVTSRLTPHLRLHGVAFLLEVEELAGGWERIRELCARAEQAVAASTPCVHRPRSLLVCALASAYLGDDEEAGRLERLADSLGESHGGALDAPRVRLALHRGDLAAVERLLAESEAPRKLIRSTKFAPVAARLDALAALGERARVEVEAPALARSGTYLEPFALRTLGIVRGDPALIEGAAVRFDEMGLGWHAAQTRALPARAG